MYAYTNRYLTTKELAQLLRLGERKVYDLASSGDIPCVRAVGKLLFPRDAIDAWLSQTHSGPRPISKNQFPDVMVGSHDPLLDWALLQSDCGLARFFGGSNEGWNVS
jgi:putative molybdopterin biosynthesis protein